MENRTCGFNISLLQDVPDVVRTPKGPPQRRTLLWRVNFVSIIGRSPSVREQAAVLVHELCDCRRQSAADSIGVNIDAIWERGLKLLLEVFGSIVHARVDAEGVEHPFASIRAATEADYLTPCNPGKLRGN